MMEILLDPNNIDDYEKFLKIKAIPQARFAGNSAFIPNEYAHILDGRRVERSADYVPHENLWDYQADISALAIRKRKFAIFADCGLGKTLMISEFAQHAAEQTKGRGVLIVSPLMVVKQTIAEIDRFYCGRFPIRQVRANELQQWLAEPGHSQIAVTNYEALTDDLRPGKLGAMILDESSMLKSHYGKWGTTCIRLGRGLDWKLCATGTPAPNDRIEYANHAIFLDQFPTVNAFLSRYFVNRGQTDNRWELKPHALNPFYRSLSHWSIFLSNPGTYGWKDNAVGIPPIHVHIHDVALTGEQRHIAATASGDLFGTMVGGIKGRSTSAQIAKGNYKGQRLETLKPQYIAKLIGSWPKESTIVWCLYNSEQERLREVLPDAANITGDTPEDERMKLIDDFKSGRVKFLVSKPKILGFGLNLQIATRHVFSGLQDSYESFYQAVKRSNRAGSTMPLNVHIPITEIERPMIETVLAKAKMVKQDTEFQEKLFRENRQC